MLKVPLNIWTTSVIVPVQPALPFVAFTFKVCPAAKVIELGIAIVTLPPLPFASKGGEKENPFASTISYVNRLCVLEMVTLGAEPSHKLISETDNPKFGLGVTVTVTSEVYSGLLAQPY